MKKKVRGNYEKTMIERIGGASWEEMGNFFSSRKMLHFEVELKYVQNNEDRKQFEFCPYSYS